MRARFAFERIITAGALCLFLIATRALADSASDFANANREYAAGHYQTACEGYEALVRTGQWNAALFYNLGNAWYRRGDLARAILNYERALALDSHHPEAMTNLRLIRDQARASQLSQGWQERYIIFGNATAYAWTAAAAFWLGVFALVAFFFSRRRSGRAFAIVITSFVISGLAVYALYTMENESRGRDLAIVTAQNIQARLATADNANSILTLPAGSEVQLLSTRGDWAYAALPNNLRGWIPTNSVERVRL